MESEGAVMSSCHICGQEAVDRCYNCGQLFCAEHGKVNCNRCETGIAAGDNRPDRVSTTRLREGPAGRHAWWRPQQAEDQELPACHMCQGLARRVCQNCRLYYCAEHAGPSHLCQECGRSSLIGIWLLLGALGVMGGIILWGSLVESLLPSEKALIGALLFMTVVLAACLLMCFSCMALFRKAGKPGWIGFVPIWNLVVLLELAGKPAWWLLIYFLSGVVPGFVLITLQILLRFPLTYSLNTLLISVPVIVLQIYFGIGLARNFKRGPDFGVGIGVLPVVFLPMLAFGDAVYARIDDE
jgi:Family of unknown function (DUF5684)